MRIETLVKTLLTMGAALIAVTFLLAFSTSRANSQEFPRRFYNHNYRHIKLERRIERRHYYRAENEDRCLGKTIQGTGSEASSEEGALKSAERAWGALVRYDHAEKFMDLKYAERYASRCQRSSTGESATAKLVEGITGGGAGILYRCRIWAEPCTAPKTTDGGRER